LSDIANVPPPDSADRRLTGLLVKEPRSPDEFSAYFRLRYVVLRQPWDQPPGSEQDDLDSNAFHLMIIVPDNRALAVGRLHDAGPGLAQIRYMAVRPENRRCGLGQLILRGLEDHARLRGVNEIFLNAREGAAPFYLSQGYRPLGPGPLLFNTIVHLKMVKTLVSP
jgi:GNAT superfamily N-acetyltransferase